MSSKYELRASADPTVTRIIPELAAEIGLNESILLLQLAYWIKLANHEHDGDYWTFQSVRDMRDKAFGYWSVATINRVIRSLEGLKLIKCRADLNLRKGDTTRWFALNVEALRALRSITVVPADAPKAVSKRNRVSQNETPASQNETPPTQNETGVSQNETTLPEITTEITPEIPTEKTAEAEDHSAAAAEPDTETPRDAMVPTRATDKGDPPAPSAGQVMTLIHDNVLALTPMVAEQVKSLLKDYGVDAVHYAVEESVKHNKRSLAYIEAVARRKAKGSAGKDEQDGSRFVSGKFAAFIEH